MCIHRIAQLIIDRTRTYCTSDKFTELSMYTLALSLILLCNFVSCQPQNLDSRPSADQCYSFVEGPFGFCSALGGYNMTFKYPDHLTNLMLRDAAIKFRGLLTFMQNCSQHATAEALLCSFFIPHCSKGERVYPCKRVYGEFLKQWARKDFLEGL